MTLRELLLNYSPADGEKIIAYYNDTNTTRNVVFETIGDSQANYFDDCLASKYRDNQVVFFYHENNKLFVNILL